MKNGIKYITVIWGLLAFISTTAQAADDIKIGLITALSGPGTSYGISMRQGGEMAVREINDEGGINGRKLSLVVVDDASNPGQSVTAMRSLISDKVDIVVGGWGSSQVLAAMEPAERAGMPYVVVGASNPRITTEKNKWVYRVLQADDLQMRDVADIAVQQLGMKRIAVIHDANDLGVANKEAFIKQAKYQGIEPVAVEIYQTSDKDFTSQLSRIRAAKPDGLAVLGTIPAAPAIMNQARELGITARFLGSTGIANENLVTLAPKASEATVFATMFHEDMDQESREWSDRYIEVFSGGAQPPRPVLAAWEYRTIKLIVAPCIKKVGTDKDKIRTCLKEWKGPVFGLPDKEAYFDETNHLVQRSVISEVRGGAFIPYKNTK
jgi:branched-chain amino acid transport system substrate-binding protein